MKKTHPDRMPCLVYADSKGEICDFPDLDMAGRSGHNYQLPELSDLIAMPEGSELFVLPNRLPVGIDPADGTPARLAANPEEIGLGIQAVAAFISPAHTARHLAAFEKDQSAPPPLPLFAYTAVGWYDGRFWVSAFRSDSSQRQVFSQSQDRKISERTEHFLRKHPKNRLFQHLGKCSLTYGCPAAKNLFLGREEAPLPTSPSCNARCVGCISLQPSGCCPSTQERITFVPSPEEIAEVALFHLGNEPDGVVSFGQGCEGEPLMQAETIGRAIRRIRSRTGKGTINLNTNASLPDQVALLAEAGLDSIRVSINSARKEKHTLYYRPKGFDFDQVKESILVMKQLGKFVSLNYFIFPGLTDHPREFEALCALLDQCCPDFIQLRNMNMDPDWYLDVLEVDGQQETMGIGVWLDRLRQSFPSVGFGYFNPALPRSGSTA